MRLGLLAGRHRRALVGAVALAVVLALLPVTSQAQSPSLVPQEGQGLEIEGVLGGVTLAPWAGVFNTGTTPSHLFSLDVVNPFVLGQAYEHNQDIAIEPKVAWLMEHYPPGVDMATEDLDGLGGIDASDHNIEAAARQAAIWHFTDGFAVTGPAVVVDRVQAILVSVPGSLPDAYAVGQARLTLDPGYDINHTSELDHEVTVWLTRGGQPLSDVDIIISLSTGSPANFVLVYGGEQRDPGEAIVVGSGDRFVVRNLHSIAGEVTATASIPSMPLPAVWESQASATMRARLVSPETGVVGATASKKWSPAGIQVLKFEDRNLSGSRDAGEPAVPGWMVEAKNVNSGAVVRNEPTGITGLLFVPNLSTAPYRVTEQSVTGWQHVTDRIVEVAYTSGTLEFVPFGNARENVLEIWVYEDVDGSGSYEEAADAILSGMPGVWHLKLYEVVGGQLVWRQTATADADGRVAFTEVPDGTYLVRQIGTPSGWEPVESATKPGDAQPSAGWMSLGPVTAGWNTFHYGNRVPPPTYSVSGHKWNGAPGTPVPSWPMALQQWDGASWTQVAETFTDDAGAYQFAGLEAGLYRVVEGARDGWAPIDPAEGYVEVDLAEILCDVTDVDFINVQTATISGYLWGDQDLDGTRDAEEPGLSGWTVEVLDDQGAVVGSATSQDDATGTPGYYHVPNLMPGAYTVREQLPAGWYPTVQVTAGLPDGDRSDGEATLTEVCAACDNTVLFGNARSGITVSKSADVASRPEPGGLVQFTVLVANPGLESVSLVGLSDDVFGDVADPSNPLLLGTTCLKPDVSPGGSYSCSFTAFVGGNAGDIHSDTVTVAALDARGHSLAAAASATVTITDVPSSVAVTKSPDRQEIPEPGGDVTFTVVLENTSPVDGVTITSLVDDVHGNLTELATSDCSLPLTFDAGAAYTCSFAVALSGNAGDNETDTVTATGTDDDGTPVSGSDQATVTIQDVLPSIGVSRMANPASVPEPGGVVGHTVSVVNHSVEPVTLNSLSGIREGDLDGWGTCSVPVVMDPAATYECSFDAPVSGNAGDAVAYDVVAEAMDDEGNVASDGAAIAVGVTDVPSSLDVIITPAKASVPWPGEQVEFTVQVTNTSAADAVSITSLHDDVYGDIADAGNPLLTDTTCAVPQELPVGGQYQCSYSVDVVGEPGSQDSHSVFPEGTDDDGAHVSGAAPVSVSIQPVTIRLAPPEAVNYLDRGQTCRAFGAQVLTGTDAGPAPLQRSGLPLGFVLSGDNDAALQGDDGDGVLLTQTDEDGQASVSVCAAGAGTAQVTAWVDVDENGLHAGDPQEPSGSGLMTWLEGGLTVTKTASAVTVYSGSEVTYAYEVASTLGMPSEDEGSGTPVEAPLWVESVLDDGCSPVASVGTDGVNAGDADQDGALDPGEAWLYACTASVDQDSTSTVTVTATDAYGASLSATDAVTIDAISPAVSIEAVPSASVIYAGGPVSFTYTVRNTGDDPLSGVGVSDDGCTSILGPVEVSGDGDAALGVGEVWQYTCATALAEDLAGTAVVTGLDSLGSVVSASAATMVDTISPALAVVKTADPERARVGETVAFAVSVSNVGDDPVRDLVLDDSMGLALSRTGGDAGDDGPLDPGETWVYAAVHTVSHADYAVAPLINIAMAMGVDSLGGPVVGEGSVSVLVGSETPPAVVSLVRWDIIPEHGKVNHTWLTDVEEGVAGYRLYRGTSTSRAGALLVGEVAALGPGREQVYSDTGLAAGTYHYWLAGVDENEIEFAAFGPEVVTVVASAPDPFFVYLPLTSAW